MEFLDKFFSIKARGSSISTEIIGGLVTFLAMVYILPVNSFMLANTGMSQPGVFVATALDATAVVGAGSCKALSASLVCGSWSEVLGNCLFSAKACQTTVQVMALSKCLDIEPTT